MAVKLQPANGNSSSINNTRTDNKIIMYIVVSRAVSRQQLSKHIPAETDKHATTEMVFSTQSVQRGYKKDN
jgi:hypothetical protein